MSTKIRLKRIGRRNRPFYRIVVMDSRKKRDGAAIEELGWFNPIQHDKPYSLDHDRALHWLDQGAQPSDAFHGLMKRSGLAYKWHLIKQGLNDKKIEKEMKKWADDQDKKVARKSEKEALAKKSKKKEAPAEEAPAEEAPAEEAPAEEENNSKNNEK